jgi:hypothetical protein
MTTTGEWKRRRSRTCSHEYYLSIKGLYGNWRWNAEPSRSIPIQQKRPKSQGNTEIPNIALGYFTNLEAKVYGHA